MELTLMPNAYDLITKQITDLLDKGCVPWKMPWTGGAPKNLFSQKAYRGSNWLLLTGLQMVNEWDEPWFLTFRQAKSLGGSVKKGEFACARVLFFKMAEKKEGQDATSKDDPEDRTYRMARTYPVFHISQTEGISPPSGRREPVRPNDLCEEIIEHYQRTGGPEVHHGGNRASYIPSTDQVLIPKRHRFFSTNEYYSTLFHELGHSTGHESRLARAEVCRRGYEHKDVCEEELVAELCSAFLCGRAGISQSVVENQAAYIQHWKQFLEDDRRVFSRAASAAEKAANLIAGEPGVTRNVSDATADLPAAA